jgi:thiol-disulfide isomerase/thioredoxin
MLLKNSLKSVLAQVARQVGKDSLFEQPGERAPTAPLPTRSSASKKAVRPTSGCVPVDVSGLKAALTPGTKALVINHWATWCESCVDELPRLVRVHAGLGEKADILGVAWELFDHPQAPDKAAAQVAAFADSYGVGFASVLFTGTPEELFQACALDFELIPQTLVLAPDGKVLYHHKGVLQDEDVFPLIRAATGKQ